MRQITSNSTDIGHRVISRKGTKVRNLNRRKAIRHHSLMCSDFDWANVVTCHVTDCHLHDFRIGGIQEKGRSPNDRGEAILRYCTDCLDGRAGKSVECDAVECALYPYRNST